MTKISVTFDDSELKSFYGAGETIARAQKALRAIQEDMITLLSEATPAGVSGAMSGGWNPGPVVASPTQVAVQVVNVEPYAHYVINPTRPARANPGPYLVRWVEKKLSIASQYRIARRAGMSETAARSAVGRQHSRFGASSLAVSVAFIIGRARQLRGSRGNDFVTPVIEKNRAFWDEVLTNAIIGK